LRRANENETTKDDKHPSKDVCIATPPAGHSLQQQFGCFVSQQGGKYRYHRLPDQNICIRPTQRTYAFLAIFTINSNYFPKQR
jgi:hypothetical protein